VPLSYLFLIAAKGVLGREVKRIVLTRESWKSAVMCLAKSETVVEGKALGPLQGRKKRRRGGNMGLAERGRGSRKR